MAQAPLLRGEKPKFHRKWVSASPLEVNASRSLTLLPALPYDSSAGLQLQMSADFEEERGAEARGWGWGWEGPPWCSLSPTCLWLNSVSLSAAGAGWEEFKGGNQNNP